MSKVVLVDWFFEKVRIVVELTNICSIFFTKVMTCGLKYQSLRAKLCKFITHINHVFPLNWHSWSNNLKSFSSIIWLFQNTTLTSIDNEHQHKTMVYSQNYAYYHHNYEKCPMTLSHWLLIQFEQPINFLKSL